MSQSVMTVAPPTSNKSLRKKKFVFIDPEVDQEDTGIEIDSNSSDSEESEDIEDSRSLESDLLLLNEDQADIIRRNYS